MKTKELKRLEATMRQEVYDGLSLDEKIQRLDDGGFVAEKQRKKLVKVEVSKV